MWTKYRAVFYVSQTDFAGRAGGVNAWSRSVCLTADPDTWQRQLKWHLAATQQTFIHENGGAKKHGLRTFYL